jgi:hypothetical protein
LAFDGHYVYLLPAADFDLFTRLPTDSIAKRFDPAKTGSTETINLVRRFEQYLLAVSLRCQGIAIAAAVAHEVVPLSYALDSSPAPARLATTPQILAGIVSIIVGQLFAGTDGPKRANEGPGHIAREAAVWLA